MKMEKGYIALFGVLMLLLGIFGTLLVSSPETEVIYVNQTKTVLVPSEPEIVYVDKPVLSSDNDVFNKLYESEIEALELEGLDSFLAEYDEEDLEDSLKDLIVGLDKVNSIEEDEDESEVKVLNLGLNDEEEQLVSIYKEYKVKYELDDSTEELKVVVVAEGLVTFDEEDGFESEIVYSLK